jgi:hypothetical protein
MLEMGKPAWTKRDKTSGEFTAVKKSAKKFEDVPREGNVKRATKRLAQVTSERQ